MEGISTLNQEQPNYGSLLIFEKKNYFSTCSFLDLGGNFQLFKRSYIQSSIDFRVYF